MNTTTKLLFLASGGASLTATAAWEKVEDFEGDPGTPAYTYVVALGSRDAPTWNYLADPLDSSNTVLWLDPETYGTEWTNVYVNWTLPTPIAENSVGTFYFKYYLTASDAMGPVVGLTDIPLASDGTTGDPIQPTGWPAFEAAVGVSGTGGFAPRDAGAYVTTDYVFEAGKWYHIFGVVYNNAGAVDDETKWYIQGPDDAAPVHVPVPDGGGGYFDTSLFRNGTTDALIGFYYGVNAGSPNAPQNGVPSYVDNLFVDVSGENLTIPDAGSGAPTWAGYPVRPDNYVDTGDWLGWIYLYTGSEIIYSVSLNNFIYMSEPAPGSGGWGFVYNFQN